MGARRSLPIPSHPIRVRRSILPLPGPLPGEAKGGGGALTPPLGAWRVGAPGTLTPSFPAGALAPGWDGEGGESRGASARQALGRRRGRPRGPPLPEGPARSEGARARARAPLRLLPSFPPGGSGRPAVPAVPAVPRRPPARPGRPAPPRSHGPGSTSTPLAPPRLGDYPGGGGRASRPLAVRPADLVSRPAPPASASHTARPCLRPSAGRPASRSLAPASIPRAGDLSGLCHRHRCFIPSDSPGLALDPPLWIYS